VIKLICFVTRHPDLGVDEFHRRWEEDHAPKVAANPATRDRLVRYEINRRKPRDYERADTPYDGVAVQWYRSWDAFTDMLAQPAYASLMEGEADLLDASRMLLVFTGPERVVIDGPHGPAKLVCALPRRAGTAVAAFREHWRTGHAAVNRDTPAIARHILRYEQHERLDHDYERADCPFDGVTIQWFASTAEFFAMAAEPEYGNVVAPDEARLLDRDGLVWLLTEAEQTIVA
jgi:hypothetical protein